MRLALAFALAASLLPAVSRAQMLASTQIDTLKIRPTDAAPPPDGGTLALSCAQNEFCAFQVAVTALGDAGISVTDISLGDLTGAGTLSGASALVYREGFLDISTPSNSAGLTGQWPDPMIPKIDDFYGETRNAFPVTIPAGTTQPFWVEVHIPVGQTAGTYSGSVTVTSSGGSATLTIQLRVRGFALPSTSSMPTAYGFDWDGPCVGHFGGYGPPNCDDQQLEALNALYFQDALNHRLTISALVYAPPVYDGGGSFTTFDSLYGPFLNGTALTGADQLQGAQITTIQYAGDQVAASYAAWASHFRDAGWFDRVFDYTCDEPPNGCSWTDIPTRAALVHAGDPEFRTLTTTTVQEATSNDVLSSLDILVPIINEIDGSPDDPYPGNQRSAYASFLQQSDTLLWMYQSCEPSSSCSTGSVGGSTGWPTMFIDEPALTNRMMQWADFLMQVEGELYYDTTYAMSSQNAWQSQYEFGNNGDGSIWYPGTPALIGGTHDIPIESFRMKMLRAGMQDYEYLHLLDTLNDDGFAQMELMKVMSSAFSFTADPGVLEQARLDMAAEIESDLAQGTSASSSSSGSVGASSSGPTASATGSSSGAASTSTGSTTGSTGVAATSGASSGGTHGSSAGASSGVGTTGSHSGSSGTSRTSAATSHASSSTTSIAAASSTGGSSSAKSSSGCGCAHGGEPTWGALMVVGLMARKKRR